MKKRRICRMIIAGLAVYEERGRSDAEDKEQRINRGVLLGLCKQVLLVF